MFKGILIEKGDAGQTATLTEIGEDALMEGDVTVDVAFSTLNYKDALAITGKGPIVRRFPMVPGIDFAGIVSASDNPEYAVGDRVVLNGWGVGEGHWGGLAGKARVRGDWLVPLQAPFSLREAMAIGTAGYTAMLCVIALEKNGVTPDKGEILVTGAAGGVGSVAVALLAKLGFQVVAMTGRPEEATYLKGLGAQEIIGREGFTSPGRPLAKERWAGAVDVVGGHVLANVLAGVKRSGAVAACGLAGGMDLPTTVAPFILRGVTLAGVDSVMCPREERLEAWRRLASDLDPGLLAELTQEVSLDGAIEAAGELIAGQIRGRIVVPVNPELG